MKLQSLLIRRTHYNRLNAIGPDRSNRQTRFRLEELETRQVLSPLVVQNPADSGPGTLRDAILQANANPAFNEIILDLEGAINPATPLPTLTGNYKIDGPGASRLEIELNGGPGFGIFNVAKGAHIEIDSLTIGEGRAQDASVGIAGGGIDNAGSLVLNGVELRHNVAVLGGGLYNAGQATILNSTFETNVVPNGEGGAYFGAAYSSVSFINSTISSNYASGSSGVAGGLAIAENASAFLADCTVTNNYSYFNEPGSPPLATGAGIRVLYNLGDGSKGSVQLYNTIVAGNFDNLTTPDDIRGPVDGMSRFNLIGDGDALWGIADTNGGNKIGTAAANGSHYFINLGPLQYNNNATVRTNALLQGSDAIDAGSNDYADPQTTDETGRNRIVNNTIDIGAYEYQPGGVNIQLDATPAAAPGQVVTLTATVTATTPGSNPITGTVTFYYNDYDPATFLAQVPVTGGKAVLTNVKIPANAKLVAAQYEGNPDFSGTNTQINLPGTAPGSGAALPGTKPGTTMGTGTGTSTTTTTGSSGAGQTKTVLLLKGNHAGNKHPHVVIHGQAHPGRKHH
jgi:hypothetical protein